MKYFVIASLVTISLMQCKQEDNTAMLIGDWQAVSWTSAGVATDRELKGVGFSFAQTGRYVAQYAGQKEEGVLA